ncbi:hypothetical protein L249_7368 [Ophiocordyceps polyrhachis-furcata BCC 54312]|uniref:Uncharacterized protein n=1 Tax=Ophiocordyceps polyrhachis-furcata BCC 54312 TaxID=1330021 RepID=A0A367L9V4_9HYPO|nr:hypothetical protein L249_7368 [Ophiocordyceps polyrhachis-furcata BCC 54312]
MQFGGETPSALPIWEAHLLKGGRPPVYLYYLHSISKRYRSGAKTRLWYLQACFVYYDVVVLFWLHTLDTYKRYIPINVKLVCRLPSRTRPEGLGGSRDAGLAVAGPRPPYVTEAVRHSG